jgi:hypothetical protein
MATTVQLTDVQEVRLSISPKDSQGNLASVDGVPTWESSDESVLTVAAVSDDGLMADAVTVGPLGTATVTVTADADLGDGVTTLSDTVDITVVASQASALNVAVGTPTERPAA